MRISTPRTPRTSLTRSSRGPEWVGTAHAPSPDVRCGHPGLRLLGADFAPPSLAPLVSYAGSRSMSSPFRGSVSGKQGKEGKEKEGKGQASSKEREKGEGKGQASSRKREKDRHLPKKAEKKAEKRTGIFRGALALGGKQEKKRKKDRHFLPFFGVPGFGGRSYALSGSGLPTPRRRTFAAAILAFAHSELTSLRHPGSAG